MSNNKGDDGKGTKSPLVSKFLKQTGAVQTKDLTADQLAEIKTRKYAIQAATRDATKDGAHLSKEGKQQVIADGVAKAERRLALSPEERAQEDKAALEAKLERAKALKPTHDVSKGNLGKLSPSTGHADAARLKSPDSPAPAPQERGK